MLHRYVVEAQTDKGPRYFYAEASNTPAACKHVAAWITNREQEPPARAMRARRCPPGCSNPFGRVN